MLDKLLLAGILKIHSTAGAKRRQIQAIASEILGASKRSIFATQRKDAKKSAVEIKQAVELIAKGKLLIKERARLDNEGIWKSALEEYAEAALYHNAMTGKPISWLKEIPKEETDAYIGALSDLSGELTRSIVLLATERDMKEVKRLSGLVRDIVAFLLDLDLTGNLRQKFDQAKQNLRKVEEICFDLSLKSR
ncbi:MAG: hypothetical protein WC477_01100 [Patescibacteria group bacterium]